eukprot:GDKJ01046806.1.p1 GENE.GDKJ01046806.1~~GDKJ01046806.1.p1  ORF type:complete len:459 (-),score=107.05 GDKJ01046806.1:51-1427(-)
MPVEIHDPSVWNSLRIPLPLHVGIQPPKWISKARWEDFHDEQLARAFWALGYSCCNDLTMSTLGLLNPSTTTTAGGGSSGTGPKKKVAPKKKSAFDNGDENEEEEAEGVTNDPSPGKKPKAKAKSSAASPSAGASTGDRIPPSFPSEGSNSHPETETRWKELREFMTVSGLKGEKIRTRLQRLLKSFEQHFSNLASSSHGGGGGQLQSTLASSGSSTSASRSISTSTRVIGLDGISKSREYNNSNSAPSVVSGVMDTASTTSAASKKRIRKKNDSDDDDEEQFESSDYDNTTLSGPDTKRRRNIANTQQQQITGTPAAVNQSSNALSIDRIRSCSENELLILLRLSLPASLHSTIQAMSAITKSPLAAEGTLEEKRNLVVQMKTTLKVLGRAIESFAESLSSKTIIDDENLEAPTVVSVDQTVRDRIENVLWKIVEMATEKGGDELKSLYRKLIQTNQ